MYIRESDERPLEEIEIKEFRLIKTVNPKNEVGYIMMTLLREQYEGIEFSDFCWSSSYIKAIADNKEWIQFRSQFYKNKGHYQKVVNSFFKVIEDAEVYFVGNGYRELMDEKSLCEAFSNPLTMETYEILGEDLFVVTRDRKKDYTIYSPFSHNNGYLWEWSKEWSKEMIIEGLIFKRTMGEPFLKKNYAHIAKSSERTADWGYGIYRRHQGQNLYVSGIKYDDSEPGDAKIYYHPNIKMGVKFYLEDEALRSILSVKNNSEPFELIAFYEKDGIFYQNPVSVLIR